MLQGPSNTELKCFLFQVKNNSWTDSDEGTQKHLESDSLVLKEKHTAISDFRNAFHDKQNCVLSLGERDLHKLVINLDIVKNSQ